MTTIVYKDGEFAWDTQATWIHGAHTGTSKVFRNGPVVFGVAGSGRGGDILEFMDIPPLRDYEPDFDLNRWIVRELVPSIRSAFTDVDAASIDSGELNTGIQCIVWARGRAGYLSGDLCWIHDDRGILGVGSGSPYAIGALEHGATPKQAVQTAIKWDVYTGGRIETLKVEK